MYVIVLNILNYFKKVISKFIYIYIVCFLNIILTRNIFRFIYKITWFIIHDTIDIYNFMIDLCDKIYLSNYCYFNYSAK